jgi:hypothetical protein
MNGVNGARRAILAATGGAAALGVLGVAQAQRATRVEVYKNPSCGCCTEWAKHMRANGFEVRTHEVSDIDPIRRRLGMPQDLVSCHTAIVEGYAIEGHVPAAEVKRMLKERPQAIGLAVPGMPQDAPGMDLNKGEPYDVLLVARDGRYKVYQHYGPKRPRARGEMR